MATSWVGQAEGATVSQEERGCKERTRQGSEQTAAQEISRTVFSEDNGDRLFCPSSDPPWSDHAVAFTEVAKAGSRSPVLSSRNEPERCIMRLRTMSGSTIFPQDRQRNPRIHIGRQLS